MHHHNSRHDPTLMTIAALIVLLASYLLPGTVTRWGRSVPPLIPNSDIQIFFTTTQLRYPDRALQRPVSALRTALIADIDRARSSVIVASFDFDASDIGQALQRAARRGVQVYVVVDNQNLEDPVAAWVIGELQQRGIEVMYDKRSAFMHDKIILIDGRITWTGSWNITTNDTYRNNNNAIRFVSQQLNTSYLEELQQFISGDFGNNKRQLLPTKVNVGHAQVEIYFSPGKAAEERILSMIAAAKSEIAVMAFSFTSTAIAEALIERSSEGVAIQVVMESRNARGSGSVLKKLNQAGITASVDGNCYQLHHKVMIIDRKAVITGSYNFSKNAAQSNDENMIVIFDQASAQQYLGEFERIFDQAQNPSRCS